MCGLFSSCCEQGLCFVVVGRLAVVMASFVAAQCCEAQYKIAGWRKSLGKWQRARSTPTLCAVGRKTSPASGYAWRQDLIINIKDVA